MLDDVAAAREKLEAQVQTYDGDVSGCARRVIAHFERRSEEDEGVVTEPTELEKAAFLFLGRQVPSEAHPVAEAEPVLGVKRGRNNDLDVFEDDDEDDDDDDESLDDDVDAAMSDVEKPRGPGRPPTKRPFKTKAEAEAAGVSLITTFFPTKPKRGRPKGSGVAVTGAAAAEGCGDQAEGDAYELGQGREPR